MSLAEKYRAAPLKLNSLSLVRRLVRFGSEFWFKYGMMALPGRGQFILNVPCMWSSRFRPMWQRCGNDGICTMAKWPAGWVTMRWIRRSRVEPEMSDVSEVRFKGGRLWWTYGIGKHLLRFECVDGEHSDVDDEQECDDLPTRFAAIMFGQMNATTRNISDEQELEDDLKNSHRSGDANQ